MKMFQYGWWMFKYLGDNPNYISKSYFRFAEKDDMMKSVEQSIEEGCMVTIRPDQYEIL